MKKLKEKNKKIPGMLWILVSFIPWIFYWVLSGFGNILGIIIPFIISLILITPQIHKKEFNLMDITSVIYFTIATIGTFTFNINIFINESGFIGYFVLFLMALISLIIKQPYTLQVSKKDYPEIYWKDKFFLAINNIITAFWVGIYLTNAVIFLFLSIPYTIIFSNILIFIGIIFSIFFPIIAPAYFVIKEFKKFDWRIETNLDKPKKEDEYDIIIVGSGIGGLTCGALASKRGYKVLVLEQHYQVGGYCSSFTRNGFVFNAGVEDVSGLWEKGPIIYLLKELDLKKDDLFKKNTVKYIFKGKEINANNFDEFQNTLIKMFPDEKENISKFFNDAQKAYIECYKDSEIYGVPLPSELIVKVFGSDKLSNYPKEHPNFYDWMNKTYKEKLNQYFKNEDLKILLSSLLGYVGSDSDKVAASSALTACVSYYLYGGYFPKGGAQNFANTLKDYIEKNKGVVYTKHKVDKILIENKKVYGVKVKEKLFKAPIVVCNANAKTIFLDLIRNEALDKKFVEYIKGLKMSNSAFMVFLGVDMELSNYPTLIKNLDDGYDIIINSNADISLAPKDKASITILTIANYYDFPENKEEYLKKKKEMMELLINKVEKIIPQISKHIIVKDASTPKTFERYTSMPEGALYSFEQSIGVKRPYFKTPIKGLYLASASTFPGGGIEAVVISGIICANDIFEWKVKNH